MTLDNPPKTVQVKNVWVVDPSIKFQVFTEDDSPFDAKVAIEVKLTSRDNPDNQYNTSYSSDQVNTSNQLDFELPFQDPNWNGENSYLVDFKIILITASGVQIINLTNFISGIDRSPQG